ncbi:MAG: hypothetical protein AB9891_17960 [Anaerolineaceae bacterium]
MDKTIECELNEVDIELRNLIENLMEPGEEVLACFRVESGMVWVQVITNRQVIAAKAIALRSGVFSFKPKIEMPRISFLALKDISHFQQGRSQDYDLFTVLIAGKDDQTLETNFTLETAARKFFKTLTSATTSKIKQSPPGSAAERLRELSDLVDLKLISEEEFQIKRSEILRNL